LHTAHGSKSLSRLHEWVNDQVDQDRIDYRFRTGDHDLDLLILQARQASGSRVSRISRDDG
jgi:hypothetical protein